MKKKFQRSDIPYKDRLLMQKHQSIAAHRDEAARVALQVACVALNDRRSWISTPFPVRKAAAGAD